MEKQKLAVAMSGGVDSSAAAVLAKGAGDAFGATMRLCDEAFSEAGAAAEICASLGMPHTVWDFRDTFRREVMERFAAEYAAGQTPNPCVVCNRFIKFGAFLERALQSGAARIVTGHYARTVRQGGRVLLQKAADKSKDHRDSRPVEEHFPSERRSVYNDLPQFIDHICHRIHRDHKPAHVQTQKCRLRQPIPHIIKHTREVEHKPQDHLDHIVEVINIHAEMRDPDAARERQQQGQKDQRDGPDKVHGRPDPVCRRKSRDDPERDHHFKSIYIQLFQDQHVFGNIDLAHDPPECIHDLYRHHHRLIEEIPYGQSDDHDHRQIFSLRLKDHHCDKHVYQHKKHRIQDPPQPCQIGASHLALKF